jgi:hypothetical protein
MFQFPWSDFFATVVVLAFVACFLVPIIMIIRAEIKDD